MGGLPLRVQPSGVDKRPSLRWEYVWTCHIIFSSGWMYVCTQLHIRSHKIMLCVYIYIYVYMCVWYRHVLYALYNQDGICVTFMYDAYHTYIYIQWHCCIYIYIICTSYIYVWSLSWVCVSYFHELNIYIYIMVYITINIYIYIYVCIYLRHVEHCGRIYYENETVQDSMKIYFCLSSLIPRLPDMANWTRKPLCRKLWNAN